MTDNKPSAVEGLLRPIIGIQHRTGQEAFDIMCDRIRYAHPAEEAGRAWMPIETAPKTSRAILVWVPENQCIYAASWREHQSPPSPTYPGGWVAFGGDWREHMQHATLWQPLPAPPSQPSGDTE